MKIEWQIVERGWLPHGDGDWFSVRFQYDGEEVSLYVEPEPDFEPPNPELDLEDQDTEDGYWRYRISRGGGHGYGARSVEEAVQWTVDCLKTRVIPAVALETD